MCAGRGLIAAVDVLDLARLTRLAT